MATPHEPAPDPRRGASSSIAITPARQRRISLESRILLLALGAALPATVTATVMLLRSDMAARTQWTLLLLIYGFLLGFAFAARERVIYPLQTLSNLLGAIREGDFSLRGRGASRAHALGEVMIEVNALGATLREQRLGALEATALLRTVIAEIDVAVFAFDPEHRLRLVNRAGERLLGLPAERLLGGNAEELGLSDCLEGDESRTLSINFPGGAGKWELRRSNFREHGLPHQLVVLTDLSRALREEERQAWQRLIRVLGHELNNSLAPIKSLAGSLESLLRQDPRAEDWELDMRRGLSVIASRAESLSRFTRAYAQLAKLPPPTFQPVSLAELITRVCGLESRLKVQVRPGPEVTLRADPDQLEQLLINLQRNAVDAALETGGGVSVTWTRQRSVVDILVIDEGPGLSNTANLFVPFFTTKPGGSGIGLVLSRQIAEAHGGSIALQNRRGTHGVEARLRLPIG